MSWLRVLYDTYNANIHMVGVEEMRGEKAVRPLLPEFHSTQKAHIEIVLSEHGEFLAARALEKSEAVTVIPVTLRSAMRTGGATPHPLFDTLEYVAGDLGNFVDGDFEAKHQAYIEGLQQFAQSAEHFMVNAILAYAQRKTMVADLGRVGVLAVDNGRLLDTANSEQSKIVYKSATSITKALVRFVVEKPGELESRVYQSQPVRKAWADYCGRVQQLAEGMCYVSGQVAPIQPLHPKYVRSSGDGAKLLSSNDEANFTFRGIFSQAAQASQVSADVSHKAHSALKWLLDRQGYSKYGHAIVAWSVSNPAVPNPLEDLLGEQEDEANTSAEYGQKVAKATAGYRQNLDASDHVHILGLDAVSSGRLAVTYYREYGIEDYLERLSRWYTSCCWEFVKFEKTGSKNTVQYLVGTPSPLDIITAAYGKSRGKSDEKLIHAAIQRLLPCIVDGAEIPRDFVTSAVLRTSMPTSFETQSAWDKSLRTTCALYKKINPKENYSMSLETNRTSRDYLYGRLLAVANVLESTALQSMKEDRPTAATRYFQQFSSMPYRTWKIIHEALMPYIIKLGKDGPRYIRMLEEITNMFEGDDYRDNRPLSGEYLLGYYCQRKYIYTKKEDIAE